MPRKIAILGGGMAGLTAAFFASELEDVEITVYEASCRLGGKGASARGPEPLQRIEEHGLHLWFGFYENAFSMMRSCYGQLSSAAMPYRRLDDAFAPQRGAVLAELYRDVWHPWNLKIPDRDGEPGLGTDPPSFFGCIRPLLEIVIRNVSDSKFGDLVAQELEAVFNLLDAPLDPLPVFMGRKTTLHILRELLIAARAVIWLSARDHLDQDLVRRGFGLLDTVVACIIALDESGVWGGSLDDLDDYDFLDWIRPHLVNPELLNQPGHPFEETCPVMRFVYNSAFAFECGDVNRPRLAAGVTLRALFRFVGYPGAGVYRMRGSMGDVVIAPLYEVLRRRGVRFEFMQAVTRIQTTNDGWVSAVEMTDGLQGRRFVPLGQDHNGRACWPASPADGPFGTPAPREPLRRGRDFDEVVIAMPIDALRQVIDAAVAARDPFRSMFDRVRTVATQSYQFWFKEDAQALGGIPGNLLGTHVEPVDTECDMTVVLGHEDWDHASIPAGERARTVAYLCGVLSDPDAADGDASARRNALDYVQSGPLYFVFPGVQGQNGPRWETFADPAGGADQARFSFQYTRANVSPSERYTLSLPGSTRSRLSARGSGLQNCVLCGDWTKSNMNAGCVEGTVVSGMLAARALGARPSIVAETDDWFWRPRATLPTRALNRIRAVPKRIRSVAESARRAPAAILSIAATTITGILRLTGLIGP